MEKSKKTFRDEVTERLNDEEKEGISELRQFRRMTWSMRFKVLFSNITIEPIVFLVTLATGVGNMARDFLFLEKVCHNELHHNVSTCHSVLYNESFEEGASIEKDIHGKAASWQTIFFVIESVPPIIMISLVSAWSDKYGRKAPMIISLVFEIFGVVFQILMVYFFKSPIYLYLIPLASYSIFGIFIFQMMIELYMMEVSSEEMRTIRVTILSICAQVSAVISVFVGGQLYKYFGYYAVFGTSFLLLILAIVYGILFFRDVQTEHGQDDDDDGRKMPVSEKLKFLFSLKTVTTGVKTLIKKRPHSGRRKLLILFVVSQILLQTDIGIDSVLFLFEQFTFNWNVTEAANYKVVKEIGTGVQTAVCFVILLVFLRGKDELLGIFSLSISIPGIVLIGLSFNVSTYLSGTIFRRADGYFDTAIMALTARILPRSELGTIFGVSTSLTRILSIMSGTVSRHVYKSCLSLLPGLPFFIAAVFRTIPYITLMILFFKKSIPKHVKSDDDENHSCCDSRTVQANNVMVEMQTSQSMIDPSLNNSESRLSVDSNVDENLDNGSLRRSSNRIQSTSC